MAAKPATGLTTFGSNTTGTTTQLDNNFTAITGVVNDLNSYANYLTDTGGANAYAAALPASTTGALTAGLRIQFKASATNTGASTFNWNAGGAVNILRPDGSSLTAGDIQLNGIADLQYNGTNWILINPAFVTSIASTVPVRQTVLSGPIDSSGYPTLLPTSCTSLNFTTSNITVSAPVVVTSSGGFNSSGGSDRIGYTTSNLTWTGLTANAVNYLGLVIAANGNVTTSFTTVIPVFQWGGTASNGNGNYTFNIQAMQMQVGNGTATAQTFTTFVGEANCNSNAVVSAVSYAYMARYRSTLTDIPPVSCRTVFNHAIGVDPQFLTANAFVRFTTTTFGWTAGMVAKAVSYHNGTGVPPLDPIALESATAMAYLSGSFAAVAVQNSETLPTTYTAVPAGNANGQIFVTVARVF